MKTSLRVIACMAVLAVFMVVQSAVAQGKLQGVWKITEVTLTGPNARTMTPVESDTCIFTKKYCSCMAVSSEKPRAALPEKDATDAQKVAAWTPLLAVTGTYDVKGQTVTIQPTIGKNPGAAGSSMTFDFKIEKNNLLLTGKALQGAPAGSTYSVKFVRVE